MPDIPLPALLMIVSGAAIMAVSFVLMYRESSKPEPEPIEAIFERMKAAQTTTGPVRDAQCRFVKRS